MPSSRQRFSKPSAVKQLPRSVRMRVTRKGKAATASSRKALAAASVSSSLTARWTRRERRSMATNRKRSRHSPSAVRSSGRCFTSRCTKPSSYSLNFAAALSGLSRRPAAQARGLEDAVDVVAAEVRQEVADHEGEVVEREAGRAPQGAHHGALLLARLPGQLVRTRGTVEAVPGPALAPLADGLGADPVAPGQLAGGLGGAGDPGPHGRGGAGVGVDREHQAVPPAPGARSRPSNRQAYAPIAQRA